jgi:hypothetical protein
LLALSLLNGYTAGRLQAFVLITSLPRSLDGFAFRPEDLGAIQMVTGVAVMATQMFLFRPVVRRYGPQWSFVGGLAHTVAMTLPFAAYGVFAAESYGAWGYVVMGGWQAICNIGFTISFPVCFVMLNRACEDHNRGTINGWANSLSALSRGLAPLAAGGLVAFGLRLEEQHFAGARYIGIYSPLLLALTSMTLVARMKTEQEPEPARSLLEVAGDVKAEVKGA